MTTLRDIIKEKIQLNGCIEIRSGVYLWNQESIKEEQIKWDEADEAAFIDFSDFEYWVTTNDFDHPAGFDSYEEAIIEIFKNITKEILNE